MNETRSVQAPLGPSRTTSTLSVPEPQDKPTVAADGLSDEEVRQRQQQYGLNEIPEKEESLLRRVLKRFWGPIPWMIEAVAILSAIVQKWEDFTIILILLLVLSVRGIFVQVPWHFLLERPGFSG